MVIVTAGLLSGSAVKDSPTSMSCSRPRFDPWVRRSPGGGHKGPFLTLARRRLWTEESGSLQPIRSLRLRHTSGNSAHTHAYYNRHKYI